MEVVDEFSFLQAEKPGIDHPLQRTRIQRDLPGVGLSRVLDERLFHPAVVADNGSVSVDTPTAELADSFVPVLGGAFIHFQLLRRCRPADAVSAQTEEFGSLCVGALARENASLMRPFVTGHPHETQHLRDRRHVPVQCEQTEELRLVLSRVGTVLTSRGGLARLVTPPVTGFNVEPEFCCHSPNGSPAIQPAEKGCLLLRCVLSVRFLRWC
mgnify:CR=1 FL=1